MNWKQSFEKFHDENRYFMPLAFIAVILMVTGLFYVGPVLVNYDVIVNRTLLFDNDTTILASTLRPGWTFSINVLSTKSVSLLLYNLAGDVVATSDNNRLTYQADFLDLYFLRVMGRDFTLIDFNYTKLGEAPYPSQFLFFGSGLALLLGVIVYYLLEPVVFKLKRRVGFVDSVFYPAAFMLSSIIFWVFRDSLVWFLPKSLLNNILLIIFPLAGVIIGSLLYKRKMPDFTKSLLGYLVAFSAVFLAVAVDYSGVSVYFSLAVKFALLGFLALLCSLTKSKTAFVMFSLTWLTSVVIQLLAYSVGVPVFFDTFLSVPSTIGTIPLFIFIILMAITGVYFFVRGVYAKNTAEAINFGLYAGICIQAILQVFSGTSLL